MKKIIFIISVFALTIGINACKTGKNVIADNGTTHAVSKQSNETHLIGKRWKLVELFGNPVSVGEENTKEAFLIFHSDDKRVSGNLGCNTFSGTYVLNMGNQIKFSEMVATRMMCLNMDIETKLTEALNSTDNFFVGGNVLILNKAKMAPLARFEAVFVQ